MPLPKRPPAHYRTPLRSRKDITKFILDATYQRSDGRYKYHPLCFNVKIYDLDFSFDNLLKIWQDNEGVKVFHKTREWLEPAKAKLERVADTLCDQALEDARDDIDNDDFWRIHWDGTQFERTLVFDGRNAGWLSLTTFGRFDFTKEPADYTFGTLEGTNPYCKMSYPMLRELYKFIVQLKHDTRKEAVKANVEDKAAFNFFANVCQGLPEPDRIQLEMNLVA